MSDTKNRGLTVRRDQLPASRALERRLGKQIDRMRCIGNVAKAAIDEHSETYTYTWYKTHMALAVTARLREAIAAGHISPEAEAAYQRDIEAFLQRMLAVAELASRQILIEQERSHDAMDNGSFFEEVVDELVALVLGY
jgi:hypothetical protein